MIRPILFQVAKRLSLWPPSEKKYVFQAYRWGPMTRLRMVQFNGGENAGRDGAKVCVSRFGFSLSTYRLIRWPGLPRLGLF